SYREGFPNVVIEAGAMGLPSIVTDINGSREIILHGRNGLVIPPRSADALRQAMADLIDRPDKTLAMASAARPLIATRFDQTFVRRCLKDYYKEIIP
ncbi:MAG: glycosyltransferase, partial [Muribaculaceae bacterium]|nr:glycosyltransferase [Muribaculaceae bacterium]